MINKIKSCPFCGGEARAAAARTEDGIMTFSVICKDCNTGIFRPRYSENDWDAYTSAEDAINAWNRRAEKEGE